MTEQLLIDCQTGSCQKTTRIAQAITTLQTLIFSLRTGQLEDLPFSLIDDEQFDEEWQWIGSYETWKAAMGVFLYPENILLPSLRRQKTPAFRELVEALRTNPRLTPQGARDLAKSYEAYFNDVCGLTVQAACTAETRIKRDVDKRPLFYMFGLGGVTGRVYWSAYDPASENAGYAQTFWEEVPSLENVTQIIGAVPYEIAEGTSFIYLFTLTQVKGATQLGFIKYDLENPKPQRWESPPTTLEDLPESATQFTALVKQRNRTDDPPHLLIRLLSPGHRVYVRHLNQEATDWAEGEWKPLLGRCIGRRITKIYAMVEIQPENFCLIASFLLSERPTGPTSIAQDSVSLATIPEAKLQIRDGVNFNQKSPDFNRRLVNYRIFGKVDDGTWREVFDGDFDFAGTFEIKETLCTFFSSQASKSSDNNNYWFKSLKAGKLYTPDSPMVGRINLDRLNDWLSEVNALDLRNVIINLKDIYQAEEDSFVNLYIFLNTERSVDTLYKVIDWFADQIDNAEYTDKTWGDWKVASDWIPQLSIPSVFDLRQALKLLFVATNYQFKYRHIDALSSEYRTEKDRIIAPTWGKFSSNSIYVAYTCDQQRYEFYRGKFIVPVTNPPNIVVIEDLVIASFVKPQLRYYLSISEQLSTSELQIRQSWIATVFDNNGLQDSSETNEIQPPFSLSNLTYLEDAFYFVPAALALQLQRAGQYTAALDWYRTVYDYTVPLDIRKIYYGLQREETYEAGYNRGTLDNWLSDPLDIHKIASTRRNTYTRFTLFSILRCLLADADAEFTRDTAESLPNARTLYETALELLDTTPELQQYLGWCSDVIGHLEITLEDSHQQAAWQRLLNEMAGIRYATVLSETTETVQEIMGGPGDFMYRLAQARQVVQMALTEQVPTTIATLFAARQRAFTALPKLLLVNDTIERGITQAPLPALCSAPALVGRTVR